MTSILSDISKQFGKLFLLGAFLPALVFAAIALLSAGSLAPDNWAPLEPLRVLDTQWRLLATVLIAIILGGLLYNLNIPLLRFYEGYTWQDGPIGRGRTGHYRRRFATDQSRLKALESEWQELKDATPGAKERASAIRKERNAIRRRVNTEFPIEEGSILPTRLGNVIRSFEDYPQRQYQIAAITLWPRLVAKINKDYAGTIDDAKLVVDFMINCSTLSAALALLLIVVGLRYAPPPAPAGVWLPWLLGAATAVAAARLFYLAAVGRAAAWGATVKAAFDLYRWDLLKQLGYTQLPASLGEERALWRDISLQMIYGDAPSRADLRYAPAASPRTSAKGQPADAPLDLARGVQLDGDAGALIVVIAVAHTGGAGVVDGVIIRDTPPDGYEYEWGSACVDGRPVPVSGTGAYRFAVGSLSSAGKVELSYRAIPRVKA